MRERERFVQMARQWIGTRFHHQGRKKASKDGRGGVDCLGLLIGVANECGLRVYDEEKGLYVKFSDLDVCDYGHLPDGGRLREALDKWLLPVAADALGAGDVVLMSFDGNPQHLAILTDYADGGLGLLHAYAPVRKVVEHPYAAEWQVRLVQGYRIPDDCFCR